MKYSLNSPDIALLPAKCAVIVAISGFERRVESFPGHPSGIHFLAFRKIEAATPCWHSQLIYNKALAPSSHLVLFASMRSGGTLHILAVPL
jgi:hypothetical protein